jgi:diguanylate cyclase (GGDEF)-like protein
VIALQTFWFEFIQPDIAIRSIANSMVLASGYAACAYALLIRVQQPLRTAYWFTGLLFALLAAVLLARAVMIWHSHLDSYGLYANIPLNPLTFLIACMLQAGVTFGFLLMLNYQLVAEIQKVASRDTLTGAFNRRRLEEEAIRLQSRCKRTGDTFAVMLIDIDQFKFINDNYGHPVGDEVLRNLAAIAQASIRTEDYFARYGGDEFCILLPSTSVEEAFGLAERLRLSYATRMRSVAGFTLDSTVSIGVADSSRCGMDFKEMIAAADAALYEAKQAGRNRVKAHA